MIWKPHNSRWRSPIQVITYWEEASEFYPSLFLYQTYGKWWETLEAMKLTLLVTREYEHLVLALCVVKETPHISYLRIPHPSGLVVNKAERTVYIASTRNPNQVYTLKAIDSTLLRKDTQKYVFDGAPLLIPTSITNFPGCLYLHDLALINGNLYGNSTGQNAVVHLELGEGSSYEKVWWPRCIEISNKPACDQNYIQLNSIAAGENLQSSFFTASTDKISFRRPGHQNFPVDGRGVVFSGKTREPITRGLTRPHSARLFEGKIWLDNSGYGEVGFIDKNCFIPVMHLSGWTRGLCLTQGVAFVGTSQVIPRFQQYAPGLRLGSSRCGIHIIDISSGSVIGGLVWPYGNQVSTIDWVFQDLIKGFPFYIFKSKYSKSIGKELFYTFDLKNQKKTGINLYK